MVRRRTTEVLIHAMPTWAKIVVATGALITTLYGAVRFVADAEYARFETQQKKIGREEFEKRMGKLDERLRAVEAHGNR